jgi:hypothetical protein
MMIEMFCSMRTTKYWREDGVVQKYRILGSKRDGKRLKEMTWMDRIRGRIGEEKMLGVSGNVLK